MGTGLKWCFIGGGVIAQKVARDSAGIQIASVCTRHMESAEPLAHEVGARAYTDSEAAMAAADIVYIAVQHPEHKECTLRALRAGKPVLCEKPLAINAREVAEMIAEAEKQNLYMAEAMWTRYNPIIKSVRAWIRDGEIGDVHYITADFAGVSEYDPSKYHFQLARGGGSLLDVGVYPVAFAQMILGKPQDLCVHARISGGIDHRLTAMLQYEDGRAASVFSAFDTASRWTATIHGSKGHIVIPEYWQAREATMFLQTGEEVRLRRGGCVGWGYQMRGVEEEIAAGKKQSDVISHRDSLEIAAIMDAIREKAGVVYPFE